MQQAFEQADEEIFQRVRGLFGGHVRQAVTGAAPIAPEILEFFYACRRAGARGLGHDRDDRRSARWARSSTSSSAPSGGRCRASRSGSPRRTARSSCAGPTSSASTGSNPEATAETLVRRLAAHRRPRRARRRGLPEDHRPQEGHHHHRRRQEPDAGQHRERPQAVAGSSPRRSCTATAGPTRWR